MEVVWKEFALAINKETEKGEEGQFYDRYMECKKQIFTDFF